MSINYALTDFMNDLGDANPDVANEEAQVIIIDHVTKVPRRELTLVQIMGERTFNLLEKRAHGARGRCTNPDDKDYKSYGARGIEFRFKTVIDFVGHCYFGLGFSAECGLSIDRINNNLHYEAGNLRLATPKQQVRNRGVSTMTTFAAHQISHLDLCDYLEESGVKVDHDGVKGMIRMGMTGDEIFRGLTKLAR